MNYHMNELGFVVLEDPTKEQLLIDEAKSREFQKELWDSIPDEKKKIIAATKVVRMETRAGPSWFAGWVTCFDPPIDFQDALQRLGTHYRYRRGFIDFETGARLYFVIGDPPYRKYDGFVVPKKGEVLAHPLTISVGPEKKKRHLRSVGS